jgi:ribosome-associated protein
LEPLIDLQSRKRGVTRLTKNSRLFKSIIKAIQDKKGTDIVSLDLRKVHEAVADFFIICQANNTTQIKAIGDWIEHAIKEDCGESPYHHEGRKAMQWVIIDYVNIVVHIMHPEAHRLYQLEEMWSDAVMAKHDL